MTLRAAIRLLLILVLGLPLVQAMLFWTRGLLVAMGDHAAAAVIRHVSTGAGVTWLASLVGLVIALAVDALDRPAR
jgi:hypothetical protein